MITSRSNGWRSINISLCFGLPVTNLPLFHLTAGWCTLSVDMIDNGKKAISRGVRRLFHVTVGGGSSLVLQFVTEEGLGSEK